MANINESTTLLIESVILQSDRFTTGIDISPAVSDIEIYESILVPYLTGTISFIDAENFIQRGEYAGDEYVIISLKKYNSDKPSVAKKFYLDKIISSKKVEGANSMEVFVFHMVEHTLFESSLTNISKAYRGSILEIIDNIIANYVPGNFLPSDVGKELDRDIKVIVPNLTPMDAITWLRKRCLNTSGMPYFIYTTLFGGPFIYAGNLQEMLEGGTFNKGVPFKNYQSSVQFDRGQGTETPLVDYQFQILDYEVTNTEDFYSLIKEGFVGSDFNYYDVINGENVSVQIDAELMLRNFYDNYNLKDISLYPYGSSVYGKNLASQTTKRSFHYPTVSPHETGFSSPKSFLGEKEGDKYINRVTASVILKYLNKHRIDITLPGNFFAEDGTVTTTIGNKIELEFLGTNQLSDGSSESVIDYKKSGDYLITKAVHLISRENYNINFEVCKVSDVESITEWLILQ